MIKIFRLKDALVYGGVALFATLAGLKAVHYNDYGWSWTTAKVMVVPVMFWLAYGVALLWRVRHNQSIWYESPWGVCLRKGDLLGAGEQRWYQMDSVISDTLDKWRKAIPGATLQGTIVTLKVRPFRLPGKGDQRFNGVCFPHKHSVLVGVLPTQPLHLTALAHEFSHQILWNAGITPTEERLAFYKKEFGTP